jgi:hypothetical protein
MRMLWCPSDRLPGIGMWPPPISPASEMVWWGARNGRVVTKAVRSPVRPATRWIRVVSRASARDLSNETFWSEHLEPAPPHLRSHAPSVCTRTSRPPSLRQQRAALRRYSAARLCAAIGRDGDLAPAGSSFCEGVERPLDCAAPHPAVIEGELWRLRSPTYC